MKKILSLLLVATLVGSLSATWAMADGQSIKGTKLTTQTVTNDNTYLQFETLRETLTKHNTTVKSLRAQADDAKDAVSAMSDGIAGLEEAKGKLTVVISGLEAAKEAAGKVTGANVSVGDDSGRVDLTSFSANITGLYGAIIGLYELDVVSLNQQISSMENQKYDARLSTESACNSIDAGVNKLIQGAESLYTAIVTMEAGLADMDRGIATLERMVNLFQKQYDLGLVSQYDLQSMEYQLRMLQSNRLGLEFQITTNKMSLESMCGMARTGTVYLNPLPMPTAEELAEVDFETNLNHVLQRNADVANAELSANQLAGPDSADLQYTAAKDTATANFYLACLTIPEKQRLVATAEDTLAFQERTLEVAAKKLELGMISQEEYLTAQADVDTAHSGITTAQVELFTAYRSYISAVKYGLV